MDKETLRNMDQKTYQKMLEDAAFDEINTMLNISKGHSQELHENITNEDLIKRIITEEKENISSFWDNESLKDGVSNVIAYRSQAITKWLFKERYEFDNPKDYKNYVYRRIQEETLSAMDSIIVMAWLKKKRLLQ